jgi:probable biosynthetic protein (TIGR04098 family)
VTGGELVARTLAKEIPGFDPAQGRCGWAELGLDSFGLLTVRAACEAALGHEFSDADWTAAETPDALIRLAGRGAGAAPHAGPEGLSLIERVELGMPQMAMRGLSESWLLKALGDLHWRLIAAALRQRPRDIADAAGNRLYPTFTRLRFVSDVPLTGYGEGETLTLHSALSHFGPGIFFSEASVAGEEGRRLRVELMSSFAWRGAAGNIDLQRGQPVLPDDCPAIALEAMPEFGRRYRERRESRDALPPVLARERYELVPAYDINGVGLLYYAAYPMIADICEARAAGRDAAAVMASSTVERDICYFANADAGAGLEWRLHAREASGSTASIVRDDGAVMAWIHTRRAPA